METKELDYTTKLLNKNLDNLDPEDVNGIIIFFNYCFREKNNFFIENFNTRQIRNIYLGYNKTKTNILTDDIDNVFDGISKNIIKLFRFIFINFQNNYSKIIDNNSDLYRISNESLTRIIYQFSKLQN